MRILLIVHQFLPRYFFGTEVLTFQIARQLRADGHHVLVLCGTPAKDALHGGFEQDTYAYEDLTVIRFSLGHRAEVGWAEKVRRQYIDPSADAAYEALLDEFRPDVVHVLHLQNLSTTLLDVTARRRVPVFFTATDFWLCCPYSTLRLPDGSSCSGPRPDASNCVRHYAALTKGNASRTMGRVPEAVISTMLTAAGLANPLWSQALQAARAVQDRAPAIRRSVELLEKIFAPTLTMADSLRRFGITSVPIEHLTYGVDLEGYSEARPIEPGRRRLCFGYIGSMSEHKGAHLLIEAVRALADIHVEVAIHGWDASAGEYAHRLRLVAGSDERIHFYPTFAPDELPEKLAEIDCLVVPSTWAENAPLVAICAQAARRPLVVSNVPGLTDIVVDGKNGRLFAAGDVIGLSAVLRDLAAQPTVLAGMAANIVIPKSTREYVRELHARYEIALNRRRLASMREAADVREA